MATSMLGRKVPVLPVVLALLVLTGIVLHQAFGPGSQRWNLARAEMFIESHQDLISAWKASGRFSSITVLTFTANNGCLACLVETDDEAHVEWLRREIAAARPPVAVELHYTVDQQEKYVILAPPWGEGQGGAQGDGP